MSVNARVLFVYSSPLPKAQTALEGILDIKQLDFHFFVPSYFYP